MSTLLQMKWEDYKAEFEFDGSWRDIYVLNASVEDWQRLIDFAHSGTYKISYTVDGNETPLPQQATEIFIARNESSPLLSFQVGAVLICCHFFMEEEIEFDIDPREIRSESQAEEVFTFMRQIGQLLNKGVILTPENFQSNIIFKFLPSIGQVQYTPSDT